VIKKLLESIFGTSKLSYDIDNRGNASIPTIKFDEDVKRSLVIDWDVRFPISGDTNACARFKEIIEQSLLNGSRVQGDNIELLEMIESGSVILNPIAEFQRKAAGKFKIVNRKAIITDNSLDELPYGTLSNLLKNNPKACLKAFEIAVRNYAMTKYHIARYVSDGIRKGKISAVSQCARRCKLDKGRIISLDPNAMIIPHFLGCSCLIIPIVSFK